MIKADDEREIVSCGHTLPGWPSRARNRPVCEFVAGHRGLHRQGRKRWGDDWSLAAEINMALEAAGVTPTLDEFPTDF